jgi:hypothetical protein
MFLINIHTIEITMEYIRKPMPSRVSSASAITLADQYSIVLNKNKIARFIKKLY